MQSLLTARRVFVDDFDMHHRVGGGGYAYYGVGAQGAVAVVRPDGYIGMVAPFERVQDITAYFAAFLLPHTP